MTLTESQRKAIRNWAAAELAQNDHSIDEFDVEAEIDNELSVSENYKLLASKMRDRGLMASKATSPDRFKGQYNYQEEIDRRTEENAEKAYKEYAMSGHGEAGVDDEIGMVKTVNPRTKEQIRLDERASRAAEKIKESRERLAVSELERQQKAYARAEFERSTAGRMLAGLQGVGRGVPNGNRSSNAPMRGSFGSSMLQQAMMGDTPGLSLSNSSQKRYVGEVHGGASLALGMPQQKRSGGRYVTVVERGVARRVYVGGDQGQYSSTPSQPAPQSPLGLALSGGASNIGRGAEKNRYMGQGGSMLQQAMFNPGSQRRNPENRPTLLQQATLGGNKASPLFSGSKSKSHNSLFAAAISNKSKLKWR